MRQMSILLTVYLEAPPHTVRGLAAPGLVYPSRLITRALDSMGKQNLISRRRDDKDKRNVLIQRTVEGALFIERLADTVVRIAGEQDRL